MDTRQVSQGYKGVSEWYPFNEQSLESIPEKHGFYMFRKPQGQPFCRLIDASDICYIGSTKNINRRFNEYLHPGYEDWQAIRIHDMAENFNCEFAWCISENFKDEEQKLLNRYRKEHGELPPLNYAQIRKYYGDLSEPLPSGAYEDSKGKIICPCYGEDW